MSTDHDADGAPFITVTDPPPSEPATDERVTGRGWFAYSAPPAAAGLTGSVGLGLLVAGGGMPTQVAWAIGIAVAAWAAVTIYIHITNSRTTSDNEE